MQKRTDIYQSPLEGRYPSKEMLHLFSDDVKFSTWRKLWVALAEIEQELGIDITDEQIQELKKHIDDINYEEADARERICRHDVMAHVYAYGLQAEKAKGIIHLGATSCYVTDNADIIIFRDALRIIKKRLVGVIKLLTDFAEKNKTVVTLGYTHYQPAQLVTVGKRATLWIENFCMNLAELKFIESQMKLLGSKGTTGTQESFKELFEQNATKVKVMDKMLAEKFDFESCFAVSGQTYPRLLDEMIVDCLKHVSSSCAKLANDIRLLQHDKQLEEPFGKDQIGSSAMAYKRNPMRSERIASLARIIPGFSISASITTMTQWLERTLDDSAARRIYMPQSFLTLDAMLIIVGNVSDGLVVYDKIIEKAIKAELPFMVTEKILMEAVMKGGDRQELHEKIRLHSMEATRVVKLEGGENDLIDRIVADPIFGLEREEIERVLEPANLCGIAPQQVEEFISKEVNPILQEYAEYLTSINTEVLV